MYPIVEPFTPIAEPPATPPAMPPATPPAMPRELPPPATKPGSHCKGDCVANEMQCGGTDYPISLPCCEGVCVAANTGYAACIDPADIAKYVNQDSGWDGTVLDCEPMTAAVSDSGRKRIMPAPPAACPDGDCKQPTEQCAGDGFDVSAPCCDVFGRSEAMQCVVKDKSFAACLPMRLIDDFQQKQGWDGTMLNCEAMPDSVPEASAEVATGATRRLLFENPYIPLLDGAPFMSAPMPGTPTPGVGPSGPEPFMGPGPAPGPGAPEPAEPPAVPPEVAPVAARDTGATVATSGAGKCVAMGEQCGGTDYPVSLQCCTGAICVAANDGYAECIPPADLVKKIIANGWDGTALSSQPMPQTVYHRDVSRTRRLLAAPDRRQREVDRRQQAIDKRSEDVRKSQVPKLPAGKCVQRLGRCGEAGGAAVCCEGHLQCVKENDGFAQCALCFFLDSPHLCLRMAAHGDAMASHATKRALPACCLALPAVSSAAQSDDMMQLWHDISRCRCLPAAAVGSMRRNWHWDGTVLQPGDLLASADECRGCLSQGAPCAAAGEVARCCKGELLCVKRDSDTAQCVSEWDAESLQHTDGWDGTVLPCGKIM